MVTAGLASAKPNPCNSTYFFPRRFANLMSSSEFSPWVPRGPETEWRTPLKRLTLDEARKLLAAARGAAEPAERVSRLLALRRCLAQTWRLNHAGESSEETEATDALAKVAATVSSAIESALKQEPDLGGAEEAVSLEVRLLDHRAGGNKPGAGELDGHAAPEGPRLSGAYGDFVRGMWQSEVRHPAAGVEVLTRALHEAQNIPDAQRLITRELLPVLHAAGHDEKLIVAARSLVDALSMSGKQAFDLGWALHWLARAHEHEGNWKECVECARESNLQLFKYGASQQARPVGTNYYLVARGMVELDEWGEAAALAQLSLRSLPFTEEYPGRADALVVLARCLASFEGDKPAADARGILTRLLDERPPVAGADAFYEEVEKRLADLGPGPVSEPPGRKG